MNFKGLTLGATMLVMSACSNGSANEQANQMPEIEPAPIPTYQPEQLLPSEKRDTYQATLSYVGSWMNTINTLLRNNRNISSESQLNLTIQGREISIYSTESLKTNTFESTIPLDQVGIAVYEAPISGSENLQSILNQLSQNANFLITEFKNFSADISIDIELDEYPESDIVSVQKPSRCTLQLIIDGSGMNPLIRESVTIKGPDNEYILDTWYETVLVNNKLVYTYGYKPYPSLKGLTMFLDTRLNIGKQIFEHFRSAWCLRDLSPSNSEF